MTTENKQNEKKKFCILVTPLDGFGHMNACLGFVEELISRKHRIVFAINEDYKGYYGQYGYEERVLSFERRKDPENDQLDFWQGFIMKYSNMFKLTPFEMLPKCLPIAFGEMFEDCRLINNAYKQLIDELKPDLIINDRYICVPSIINSNIPWIMLCSAAPHILFMDNDNFPPYYSGLSYNKPDDWIKYRQIQQQSMQPLIDEVNEYSYQNGLEKFPNRLHPLSPYLNVYLWPKELRFDCLLNMNDEKIFGVDHLVRLKLTISKTFTLPDSLKNKSGKLIYFSLGTLGCVIDGVMERMLNILAKTEHRYIVSKGPIDRKLPENMFGESFLPQLEILPMIDMVITHGGNNTVTESLYFGRKMLVLPCFGDQFDNAQRIEELGYGLQACLHSSTESEIHGKINQILADGSMDRRLTKISERLKRSNDKEVIADLIEKIGAQTV